MLAQLGLQQLTSSVRAFYKFICRMVSTNVGILLVSVGSLKMYVSFEVQQLSYYNSWIIYLCRKLNMFCIAKSIVILCKQLCSTKWSYMQISKILNYILLFLSPQTSRGQLSVVAIVAIISYFFLSFQTAHYC